MSVASGFGRNFSRDVEAILSTVQLGAGIGEVYLYPHEVRENLRIAGMRMDGKVGLPEFPDPFDLPVNYEPDFGPEPEPGVTDDEEGTDVR